MKRQKRPRNPELAEYCDEDILIEAGYRRNQMRSIHGAGTGRPKKLATKRKVKNTSAVKSDVV